MPDTPPPSVVEYHEAAVRLVDIVDMGPSGASPCIYDHTFYDCKVTGPAVVVSLGDVTYAECSFNCHDGDPRSMLLTPQSEWMIGVIGLRRCTFIRCELTAVGLVDVHGDLLKTLTDGEASDG